MLRKSTRTFCSFFDIKNNPTAIVVGFLISTW